MILSTDHMAPIMQGASVDARSNRPGIDLTSISSFELQPGTDAVPGKSHEQVKMNISGKTDSHPPRC